MTLTDGVYCFSSSVGLTGTLTLDAQGDPNAVFIFQIGSTLTTASASSVNLINGAQSCMVVWQVGSSATLGTTTALSGNVLALTSNTATTGVTVDGRLLAQNGAVTLDSNTVTRAQCAAVPVVSVPVSVVPPSVPVAPPSVPVVPPSVPVVPPSVPVVPASVPVVQRPSPSFPSSSPSRSRLRGSELADRGRRSRADRERPRRPGGQLCPQGLQTEDPGPGRIGDSGGSTSSSTAG